MNAPVNLSFDAHKALMNDILQRQKAANLRDGPPSAETRIAWLNRCIDLLVGHQKEIAKAVNEDFGARSADATALTDVAGSIGPLKFARDNLTKWMKPEKRKTTPAILGLFGAKAQVQYQPKGVVGVIAPWNFPVNLVMGPIAGIFAAGNRAMVKTSEFTARTAALFEEVSPKYFAIEELAFFSGGPEVGKAFSELPFDHLIFTGATGIGRHILHAAADNLTPVTLELGGKSPVIIGKDADIARATERVAIGKMLNAGQICLAPDYMLVPEAQEQAVVDGLKAAVSSMYPTLLANPDYTAIINDRHHQRLQDWVADARAKGATVETVTPANEDFAGSNARKMPLHIVRNATDDMIVMQEELFGPILPVRRYTNIDSAIAEVNRRDRPLGLYYFGPDESERRTVLDRTISGGVTLDDVVFHVSMEELPFGGIGPSGMGSYHGFDGFKTFSHGKAVFKQAKLDVAKLAGLKPPYGKATMASVKRQMK